MFDTGKTLAENGWTGNITQSSTYGDAEIVSAGALRMSNWLDNVSNAGVQHQLLAPLTTQAGQDVGTEHYSFGFTVDSAYTEEGVRVAQPKLSVEAAVGSDGNRAGGNLIMRVPADGVLELTNYTDRDAGGNDEDEEWIGTSTTVEFDEPLAVIYTVDFVSEGDDTVSVSVYGTNSGGVDFADQRASMAGGTFEYYHQWQGSDPQVADGLAFRPVYRAPKQVADQILGWVNDVPDADEKAFLKGKGLVFSNIAYGTKPIAGIAGAARLGAKLTAYTNLDKGSTSTSIQWYRGSTAIKGATKPTYTPVTADLGKKLKVKITTKNAGGTTSVTSAATAAVGGGVISADGNPEIVGDAAVGVKLTVSRPAYSVGGLSFSYQWYRGTTKISGATKSSYTVAAIDRGAELSVKVTAKKKNHSSLALTSEATDVVDFGDLVVTKAPTVRGTLKVGKVLTATSSGWGPSTPTRIYYWLRVGRRREPDGCRPRAGEHVAHPQAERPAQGQAHHRAGVRLQGRLRSRLHLERLLGADRRGEVAAREHEGARLTPGPFCTCAVCVLRRRRPCP